MTDFKEPTVSPSPNLNLVLLCFSTTFSLSSGDNVSKYYTNQDNPHTVFVHPLSITA